MGTSGEKYEEGIPVEKPEKHPWYDTFIVGVMVAGISVAATIMILDNKKYSALEKVAKQHIEVVVATDKNCNDCHLGASFVNLFNHPAVKSNDNVVALMMDRAKIRRW